MNNQSFRSINIPPFRTIASNRPVQQAIAYNSNNEFEIDADNNDGQPLIGDETFALLYDNISANPCEHQVVHQAIINILQEKKHIAREKKYIEHENRFVASQ